MASVSAGGIIPSAGDNESQFALVSFAMGTVTGARSFKVDKLGRLTGIHYPQVWKPGENVAECLKETNTYPSGAIGNYGGLPAWPPQIDPRAQLVHEQVDSSSMTVSRVWAMPDGSTYRYTQPAGYSITASAAATTKPTKDHGLSGCSHGFYAYYDGSDDYHKPSLVSGVIEGYGESLIGTRGFRCMKAKIVALTISKELAKPVAELVTRNYHEIPLFVSFEKMVAAFPPDSSGMEPAPATDDDFWDRKI